MEYRTLGRTGFRVSVLGLGGGGGSRLGQSAKRPAEHSVKLVQQAIDAGINFIDTAESYGTEPFVGEALRGRRRDDVVLSTKKSITHGKEETLIAAEELVAGLERSLERLKTDRVEVYHLHGVAPRFYREARERLVPAMLRLKEQGKIRALGITERFEADRGHAMLMEAVEDDCWDVIMVGFNILNQSARERVIAPATRKGVGILDMFAVRNDLRQPDRLRQTVAKLIELGQVDGDAIDRDEPLGFLLRSVDAEQVPGAGAATSLTDAAYRFCRDEPGVHVVLFGTGSAEHLRANVADIERPPLPEADRARLRSLFAKVDAVSGQ